MVKRTNFLSKKSSVKQVLISMIIIAVVLPLLITAVVFGFPNNFFPKAAEENSLRVWIEPATVIAKPGQLVLFHIMAAYDKKGALISSLQITLSTDANAQIIPSTLLSQRPLQGKTTVGLIQFTAQNKGSYQVKIPPDMVVVGGQSRPQIEVGKATITVQ